MIERAIERILESENLTASLQDDDAQWLIDWGVGQARQLLKDAKDQEAADDTTHKLMMVMRALNKFGAEESVTPENIHSFAENYAALFNLARQLTPAEEQEIALALTSKTPTEVMKFLIGAVGKRDDGDDTKPSKRNIFQ